jgi:hypothetical protein
MLGARQPRPRQVGLAQRGPSGRERVDRVGLAELPGRLALARHQLRRNANDVLAGSEQEALQAARDVAAVLQRPLPLSSELLDPLEQLLEALVSCSDRAVSEQLAGGAVDRCGGVRVLVGIHSDDDQPDLPLSNLNRGDRPADSISSRPAGPRSYQVTSGRSSNAAGDMTDGQPTPTQRGDRQVWSQPAAPRLCRRQDVTQQRSAAPAFKRVQVCASIWRLAQSGHCIGSLEVETGSDGNCAVDKDRLLRLTQKFVVCRHFVRNGPTVLCLRPGGRRHKLSPTNDTPGRLDLHEGIRPAPPAPSRRAGRRGRAGVRQDTPRVVPRFCDRRPCARATSLSSNAGVWPVDDRGADSRGKHA